MTTHVHGWTRPVEVFCRWLYGKTLHTVNSLPSPAPRENRTGRTMTPIIFTPVSPVPTSRELSVELVPTSCWFSNVRDHVNRQQWDQLRRQTYRQAKYCCEICGGRGPEWPVECHEVWHYDDMAHVQTLVRLIALCPACHMTKHIGLAEINGRVAEARAHLTHVNGWTEAETAAYLAEVWAVWEERSNHDWRLDLSWLEQWGIFVQPKR